MSHQPSTSDSGTPHVSKIWSNIFEPVIIPRGECQTVRKTYNIFETEPDLLETHQTPSSKSRTPTTKLFSIWTPSNLFNAVQPLRNDYKLRPKVQKCLSFITEPGHIIPPDLQLPVVIHLYLARQNFLRIDDTQLSAYLKAVYEVTVSPESISGIGDRIFDLDMDTSRHTNIPHHVRELSDRLLDFDLDRLMHLHSKYPMRDMVLFMDSVWLSLDPSAQEATVNEWVAYAELSQGTKGARELKDTGLRIRDGQGDSMAETTVTVRR